MSDENNNDVTAKIDNIEYVNANIGDIEIKHEGREKGKNNYTAKFDGKVVKLSPRFWSSMGSRFRVNQSIFTYFSPEETLERVQQVHGADSNVRFAIEKDGHGNFKQILALSSYEKKLVKFDEIIEMVKEKGGKDIAYNDGVVSGIFKPNSGEQAFSIGGDDFTHLYKASFPVDGYGDPRIALALERLVCANGMVAESSAHTAKINLGKDNPLHGISRALDTYANEEGYEQLVKQVELAQTTTASVAECNLVGKALTTMGFKAGTGGVLSKYQAMCGNLCEFFGEASLDAINERFQQNLPSKCTVYDILNFITELSSHHVNPDDFRTLRTLNALTGTFLSGHYDLEGLEHGDDDFQDLFLGDKGDGFDDK